MAEEIGAVATRAEIGMEATREGIGAAATKGAAGTGEAAVIREEVVVIADCVAVAERPA
jgi:hypothetical protein